MLGTFADDFAFNQPQEAFWCFLTLAGGAMGYKWSRRESKDRFTTIASRKG